MKKLIAISAVILGLVIVLVSVYRSNPRNIKLSAIARQTPDLERVGKSDLPNEDRKLLARFMIRNTINESITASTVGEAIDKQKEFEEEARKRREEAELKEVVRQGKIDKEQETLRSQFPVEILEKSVHHNRDTYLDYNTVRLSIGNRSEKRVRAIQVTIMFSDLFGDSIIDYSVKETIEFGSNEKVTRTYYFEYNKFIASNVSFRTTPLEDMRYKVYIDAVIFTDGTKIQARN